MASQPDSFLAPPGPAMLRGSLPPEVLIPAMPELPPLLCDEDLRRAFLFSPPQPAKPALPPLVLLASCGSSRWSLPGPSAAGSDACHGLWMPCPAICLPGRPERPA
jgi:hypothetical protein